jgi:sugar phosphate isomerase/epimerase
MKTGLVSVSFRTVPYADVIALVKKSGLDGIEWGGDVHCPPGDYDTARVIGEKTREAGLLVISYGSYYRTGTTDDFEPVLQTAITLGAPVIRVWAGEYKPSVDATEEEWQASIKDIKRICDLAKPHGIKIGLEYHDSTLTDTLDGTLRLIEESGADNIYTYWQMPDGNRIIENFAQIETLVNKKYLLNFHMFICDRNNIAVRLPLNDGAREWREYIEKASELCPGLLLEFVKDNCENQFLEDAKTLLEVKALCEK